MLDMTLDVILIACIAAIDAALVVSVPWMFAAGYVLTIIGLTFYVYLKQDS